jgi:hypothetical protein
LLPISGENLPHVGNEADRLGKTGQENPVFFFAIRKATVREPHFWATSIVFQCGYHDSDEILADPEFRFCEFTSVVIMLRYLCSSQCRICQRLNDLEKLLAK